LDAGRISRGRGFRRVYHRVLPLARRSQQPRYRALWAPAQADTSHSFPFNFTTSGRPPSSDRLVFRPTFRLVASRRASARSGLTPNHITGPGLRWKRLVISAHFSSISKTDTIHIMFHFEDLVFLGYLQKPFSIVLYMFYEPLNT